jgi:hypothetical protein
MLQARRWGANMIRLSVSSSQWDKLNCHYKKDYAARVDQAVRAVTSSGMVALIDLHFNTVLPCDEPTQQMMADQSALPFWRDVAYRYKNNPLVAFDLYNEPHWISDEIWLHGGWVYQQTTKPFQAVGMQQMYDVVRQTGAKNLIIVTGNDWGNRLPDVRVTGTNIVYGLHVYTCPITPEKCSSAGMDPTHVLQRWVAPSAQVPVAVTEFGWPSPHDGWYLAKVISFAKHHRWGWIAFGWDGRTDGNFSLLSSMSPSYQPSASGIPVLSGFNFR